MIKIKMVMMHSPNSNSVQTEPNSPEPVIKQCNNNNTISVNNNNNSFGPTSDTKFNNKLDSGKMDRTKQNECNQRLNGKGLNDTVTERDDGDSKNKVNTYQNDLGSDLDDSGKYSIERLRALTDHSISRLSPSDETNQSNKTPSTNQTVPESSVSKLCAMTNELPLMANHLAAQALQHHHIHPIQPHPHFPIKYPNLVHPSELELERFKLARSMATGKDLSDFGFRIQLGGLASNYARSDTSEELVVDGNDDDEVSSQSTSAVSSSRLQHTMITTSNQNLSIYRCVLWT